MATVEEVFKLIKDARDLVPDDVLYTFGATDAILQTLVESRQVVRYSICDQDIIHGISAYTNVSGTSYINVDDADWLKPISQLSCRLKINLNDYLSSINRTLLSKVNGYKFILTNANKYRLTINKASDASAVNYTSTNNINLSNNNTSWVRADWVNESPTLQATGLIGSALVMSLAPIAYYGFDETTGTVVNDSYFNGYSGTYQGGYILGQTGKFGSAVKVGAEYANLTGASGSYVSTPDSAAASITGDLDLRVDLSMTDWTPSSGSAVLSKWDIGGSSRSYHLLVHTDGQLRFQWRDSGGTTTDRFSGSSVTFANGTRGQIRVTLDVDNGADQHEVKFWTRSSGTDLTVNTGWTQLGSTATLASTTSVFDGTAELGLGSSSGTTNMLDGRAYRAVVLNGINGTVAAEFHPARDAVTTAASAFSSTVVSQSGETWTANSPASLQGGGLISVPSSVNPWSGAFTISTWVRSAAWGSGYQSFLTNESYLTNGFRFGLQEKKPTFWTGQSGGTLQVKSPSDLTDNVWHHVAVTVTGDATPTATLYVNGAQVDQQTASFVRRATGGATMGTTSGMVVACLFDETAIFDKVLTSAEINSIYNATSSISYVSTPDSNAINISDMDVRVRAKTDDWTSSRNYRMLIAQDDLSSNRCFAFLIQFNALRLDVWNQDGVALTNASSSINPPFTDGQAYWLRATLDIDNDAGGNTITYYYAADSPEMPTSWTQLGIPRTNNVTGVTIKNGSNNINIAAQNNGKPESPWEGHIYYAEIRNGINGNIVMKFDPAKDTSLGATSFNSSSTGELWTLNGASAIVGQTNVSFYTSNEDVLDSEDIDEWSLVESFSAIPHGITNDTTSLTIGNASGNSEAINGILYAAEFYGEGQRQMKYNFESASSISLYSNVIRDNYGNILTLVGPEHKFLDNIIPKIYYKYEGLDI